MLSHKLSGALDYPPLVFLHGFLGAKEDWEPVVKLLEERFLCITLDLPEDNVLEEIASFLENLKCAPYALVGYSLGGRLALMLQDKFPSLFSKLLIFSAHPGLKSEQERAEREKEERRWQEKLQTLSLEAFLDQWYAQPLFDSLVKKSELFANVRARRAKQNRSTLANHLAHFALSKQPHFSRFDLPTHFIYGEEDLKYAALYRTLPASVHVKTVAGCGHALHLENPSACAEIITESYV